MSKRNSLLFNVVRSLAAIAIALIVATFLVFFSSTSTGFLEKLADTAEALEALLVRPFIKANGTFNSKAFLDVLASMIPIMFTGLATTVMFSANQFNLGSEGGIMLGAFIAALSAIYLPLPTIILPIVSILLGSLAAMLVLLIPATLKAKLNISEMVNSLMLNYIIMYLINFVLTSYVADRSKGQLVTHQIQKHAALPQLVGGGSKLSVGFIIGLIAVILVTIFMYRTRWGYNIRMIGKNQEFARYSGINVAFYIILAQAIGGILAGMGGAVEMLGRYNAYDWKALPGYGWTGITVAILANNNPAFVPFAAFFMSFLGKGTELMSTYSNVPNQLLNIIQAIIFLFFAANNFLSRYRQRLVVKSAEEEMASELGGK
ncbi:MAG: ABC transporter permease [Erysipelothrix sp.]|nr:ABC transporter permease [Erysipelothrix sp.]